MYMCLQCIQTVLGTGKSKSFPEIRLLPPIVTTYRRHLHCGCAWAEDLVDQAAVRADPSLARAG